MAAGLRDIKRRIGSVKNTRQITKAMKMVSGAKLKRAQDRATNARPYADAIRRVLGRVAQSAGDELDHPLMSSYDEVSKVLVVVVASDKGLCGGFNGSLFRKTRTFLSDELAGKEVELRTYGKKSTAYFATDNVVGSEIDLHPTRFVQLASDLANHMTAPFEAGDVQEVYLVYNEFRSVMTQEPVFHRVLPLTVDQAGGEAPEDNSVDYEFEPSGPELLDVLLPLLLQTSLLQAFFESEAGEHASRMKAMDAATRNASELIDSLTLQYNRARQAAITTEIIEIVSGAEAL
jgi:F-type H+-transporting ATPase subunit gamma